MRFADGHSTYLGHETPPLILQPPTSFQSPIRGWKSQLLLNSAAGSPIFSIWDGKQWENHQITLQINLPPPDQPILLGGLLTTNIRGLFVFYVSTAVGLPPTETSIVNWLKANYNYNSYINPFVIRQIPWGSAIGA